MIDYKNVIQKINNLEMFGIRLGLNRIRKLLNTEHNPQNKLRIIHIAGTNGKGSTAAFIANMLEYAGYRVGLYTSPHLIDIKERIKVNGNYITKNDLARLADNCFRLSSRLKMNLTYFEMLTAIAFEYFDEQQVDYVVLETGLGGRLDATNVITKPLISVITNIDYEHTQYLGTKLSQIAHEKAGIIKRNSLVVTAAKQKSVLSVLKKVSRDKNAELYCLGKDFKTVNLSEKNDFNYYGIFNKFSGLKTNLLGKHQIENAGLAVAAIDLLRCYNIYVSQSAIKEGLITAYWPGRLEYKKIKINGKTFRLFIDGAHNPAGIRTLKNSISETGLKYKKLILLTGMLADKDIKKMVKEIASLADEVVTTKPEYYRALESSVLADEFNKYLPARKITATQSVKKGIKVCLEKYRNGDLILVTGSLYIIGETLSLLNKSGCTN